MDSATYELREIADLPARVAIAEGIIKLLAPVRPARCRQLISSLFDDALKLQQDKADAASPPDVPDRILQKIIAIAADLDPTLAQSLADKYARSKDSDDASADSAPRVSPLKADLYLGIASELLEKDPARATSLAEMSLAGGVSWRTLVFLEKLRQKDAALANRLLSAALQSISSRKGNDVNELFLLYSYVFSSEQVPIVGSGQLKSYQIPGYTGVARKRPVESTLAREFLETSAQILLNPERLQTGTPSLTAGVEGDLYLLQIIEPLLNIYLPSKAQALTAHRLLLSQYLNPSRRELVQTSAERWKTSPAETRSEAKGVSAVDEKLRQADETSDPDQKDLIYYEAALAAVNARDYEKATDIAGRVSSKSRDQAKQFITFTIALEEIKGGHLEKAEAMARRDDDLVRRAFLLSTIAGSLAKGKDKNLNKATEFLNEVESIAGKLEPGQEKVSTLIGASAVFSGYDNVRSAQLLREAINAANKLEKFTGDTTLTRSIKVGEFYYVYEMYSDKLTLSEVVRQLGRKDFYSTLTDVQSLKNRVPRLRAIIDLCSIAILQDTKKTYAAKIGV